ncbi:hypothetical protein DAD186_13970 [Dermabacter vaginalis]|uniref:Uncharacterized protein n=1 Tax=Dermabacter vaginalis TaxID=1630135 RepID=A0A1B0ZJ25_9MICO|nr:hypothetical protein DAD186_13970 [Dermabacter vaginalis]
MLGQEVARTTADPAHTNTTGADGQVFLPGSPVPIPATPPTVTSSFKS